jgi:glycine oxidase
MARQIAIAGAGLAGRLFAWALARAGHEVQVLDPAPGPAPQFDGLGAAAFSAAGMLSPLAEQECGGAEVAALGWQSLTLWPQIVARLGPQPPRLRVEGSLLLAHGADRGAAARALARMPGAQVLTPAQLRALEPALAPAGLLAWLLPGEGLIHPVQAMAALHRGAAGVRWRWGQTVDQVLPGLLHLRDGARVQADWCLDMRGLGARPPLPLRGVRGETVGLQLAGHGLRRPLRLLHPRYRGVYLVPRSEDELLLGASEIESEDRSPVSLQTAVELMAAAHSVLPALAEARITRLDRHLRPALPDNLPFTHHEPGLLRLNGLYRHGWLLAPALVQRLLQASGLADLDLP